MNDENKYSLDQIQSLEKIDLPLALITVRDWIVLTFVSLTVISFGIWAFLGSLSVVAGGKCILFEPSASISIRADFRGGTVQKILTSSGASVEAGETLVTLLNPTGEEYAVVAPQAGKIDWIGVTSGDLVLPDQILVWMEGEFRQEDLKIYGFLPLDTGQLIRPGMTAHAALNAVNASRYGMLEGVVKDIFPYPISPSDFYLRKIPSDRLREYLIEGKEPAFFIVIEPLKDPESITRLRWTSKKGPPEKLHPGMLGEVLIHLADERPISFLIPALKKE